MMNDRDLLCLMAAILHSQAAPQADVKHSIQTASQILTICGPEPKRPTDFTKPHEYQPSQECLPCACGARANHAIHGWSGD